MIPAYVWVIIIAAMISPSSSILRMMSVPLWDMVLAVLILHRI